ncbi:MAG: hypothetical protein Q8M88_04335, partial [Phenylobacterium sp.]|uniref:hypothetical protein n=1 Tax=Phenylobacterium sp. TaxID=1871053 RepID=UPI002734B8E6
MKKSILRIFKISGFFFLFLILSLNPASAQNKVKLKTSLNAYSFNSPLMKDEMNLDQLLEYCASLQLDAVD